MKKFLLSMGLAIGIVSLGYGQTQIFIEDFEDGTVNYTTSVAEFTDGSGDYFQRTTSPSESFLNLQGSGIFEGMDLDGEGASLPLFLNIENIDISGFSSLEFRVYIAEGDDGSNQDWDTSDYVRISGDVDNGSTQNLIWIEGSGGTNTAPFIDTDFDGTGDGTEITNTFAQFTANISGTGDSLDIQIEFSLNSGDEDIAIDNIEVYGVAAGGTPTKLVVTSVNGGNSPTEGVGFDVTVQAQDGDDNPSNVSEDVDITLTKASGTGTLGGTLTGTITNGSNSLTISGVTFDTDGTGVSITATDDESNLTSGTSSTFSVLEAATKLVFKDLTSIGFDDVSLSEFTVEAQRSDDSVDETYTGSVTVSKSSGSGSIDGTLTVSASSGVATFDSVFFDASDTYTISATDGSISSGASSNIVVNDVSSTNDLFFSEYIEGSSNNKALEIYNNSGEAVLFNGDGTDYYLVLVLSNASDGDSWSDANVNTFDENSFVQSDSVYVIGNSSAASGISDEADETSGATFFNGNDPIALVRDVNNNGSYDSGTDVLLDVIGEIDGTMDIENETIVRKNGVFKGTENYDSDEWDSNSEDTFSFLGSHTAGPFVEITGNEGWRLLSLPITGGTVEAVSDDTPVQGIAGGSDASATDANLFIYDDAGDWSEPTNVTTAWGDGLGFALYFFDNTTNGSSELPVTLGASGSEPSSDVVVDLYSGATGRYTLVGNPFASNVDLANVSANITISSNMTFWDDAAGSYTTSSASSQLIIAPWQGYWVQTGSDDTGGQLTFGTADKTTSSTDVTHFDKRVNSNFGELSFNIESSYNTEKNLTLQAVEDANIGWDNHDLTKLNSLLWNNVSAAFEGLSDTEENILKGVEALPTDLDQTVSIPVVVRLNGDAQDLKMSWEGVETLPENWDLILTDLANERNIDLRSGAEYTFYQNGISNSKALDPVTILNPGLNRKMKTSDNEEVRFMLIVSPTTAVNNEEVSNPTSFELSQNYPNPFNPTTTINYSVSEAGFVNVSIYNLMGQKVAELVNETKSAGSHNVVWNAANISSGMYYYRLESNGQSLTRKMTLIK